MKKPENKQLKEFIIENVAKDLKFDQNLVDKVVNWCYKDATEATRTYKEVEISGLGTLIMSQSKIRKRIATLEKIKSAISDDRRVRLEEEIENLRKRQV